MGSRKPLRFGPSRLGAAVFIGTVFALLALPGCSLGYTNLKPGENSALYQHLFADLINNYDEPYWLWIRGTISGDLNGNGVVEEEIVLATIQKGDARNPGPIEVAIVVACEVGPDGKRTAMARQLLFDKSPIPGAAKPINDLGVVKDDPFTHCRIQTVADKVTLTESFVVYFWGSGSPTSVWYAGFSLVEGKLVKNLETVIYQTVPGFLTANLDKSIEASPFGYQLVFGVAAIPDEVIRKIGQPHESPLWGHVYARNAAGFYEQADERYGDNYRQLEGPWNQTYLKAVIKGLPMEDLAWFEYHIGILNHYTGNDDMAAGFLAKARRYAADPALQAAVDKALETIGHVPTE
ncbi:MAG: hypothetical protein LUC93_08960 [Planctomycetaceae bacterium]|nr:hypothetical protein [Planctomycetaceae bacterium]